MFGRIAFNPHISRVSVVTVRDEFFGIFIQDTYIQVPRNSSPFHNYCPISTKPSYACAPLYIILCGLVFPPSTTSFFVANTSNLSLIILGITSPSTHCSMLTIPATCGAAILVPEMTAVEFGPPTNAERISTPGAKWSIWMPRLLQSGFAS